MRLSSVGCNPDSEWVGDRGVGIGWDLESIPELFVKFAVLKDVSGGFRMDKAARADRVTSDMAMKEIVFGTKALVKSEPKEMRYSM